MSAFARISAKPSKGPLGGSAGPSRFLRTTRSSQQKVSDFFSEPHSTRSSSVGALPSIGTYIDCPVQAKLTINKPGDKYEQEADKIADEVMKMPTPTVSRHELDNLEEEETSEKVQTKPISAQTTPIQRTIDTPEQEKEDGPLESVQTKIENGSASTISPKLSSEILSLKEGGSPLSTEERAFFEPRFGADFSEVRIHTSNRTAQAAEAIRAKAFAKGNNIYFNQDQYSPKSLIGKRLLAHELTHALQQKRSNIRRNGIIQRDEISTLRERLFTLEDLQEIAKSPTLEILTCDKFLRRYKLPFVPSGNLKYFQKEVTPEDNPNILVTFYLSAPEKLNDEVLKIEYIVFLSNGLIQYKISRPKKMVTIYDAQGNESKANANIARQKVWDQLLNERAETKARKRLFPIKEKEFNSIDVNSIRSFLQKYSFLREISQENVTIKIKKNKYNWQIDKIVSKEEDKTLYRHTYLTFLRNGLLLRKDVVIEETTTIKGRKSKKRPRKKLSDEWSLLDAEGNILATNKSKRKVKRSLLDSGYTVISTEYKKEALERLKQEEKSIFFNEPGMENIREKDIDLKKWKQKYPLYTKEGIKKTFDDIPSEEWGRVKLKGVAKTLKIPFTEMLMSIAYDAEAEALAAFTEEGDDSPQPSQLPVESKTNIPENIKKDMIKVYRSFRVKIISGPMSYRMTLAVEAAAKEYARTTAAKLCNVISYFLFLYQISKISDEHTDTKDISHIFIKFYTEGLETGEIRKENKYSLLNLNSPYLGNLRNRVIKQTKSKILREKEGRLTRKDIETLNRSNSNLAVVHRMPRTHWFLIIRDSNGIWRNMDHTSDKQGDILDFSNIVQVVYYPNKIVFKP